jgi:hypothetical protein
LQTWLVLMRDPASLINEMGLSAFLIFQLMVGGMLLSSLLHPLIIAFVWIAVASMLEAPKAAVPLDVLTLFVVDLANILGSYLIFLGLGIGSMIDHEKRLVGRRWAMVPVYWLMTSMAAWRAVVELKTKPFFWSKTPHQPVATAPREAAEHFPSPGVDQVADHGGSLCQPITATATGNPQPAH